MADYIDRQKLIDDFHTAGSRFVYGDYIPAIVSRIKMQPAIEPETMPVVQELQAQVKEQKEQLAHLEYWRAQQGGLPSGQRLCAFEFDEKEMVPMNTERIPTDIYRQCVAISKSYYAMLRRRREQEETILHGSACNDGQPKAPGNGDPTARKAERLIAAKERNDWKIRAVEQAWSRMEDQTARDFVKYNLFEGVRMQYIQLPMSKRSMERTRSRFIRYVAEELGEI